MAYIDSFLPLREEEYDRQSPFKADLVSFYHPTGGAENHAAPSVKNDWVGQKHFTTHTEDDLGDLDGLDQRIDRSTYFAEDRTNPFHLASLFAGIAMGFVAVTVAWKVGVGNLTLLVVYSSVGSAVSLGSNVILTYFSHKTNILD